HSEIAGMTRPLPVVGISTKFPNAFRRRSYQTNIVIILIYEIVIFITLKERTYRNSIFSAFVVFFFDQRNFLLNSFIAICLAHLVVYFRQNAFRYIVHTNKESNIKRFWLKFSFVIFRPITVFQIVLFSA